MDLDSNQPTSLAQSEPAPAARPVSRVTRVRRSFGLTVLVGVWAIGVIQGVRTLVGFETAAGIAATPQQFWPADISPDIRPAEISSAGVSLHRGDNLQTLVMLVHPNCPCSRASLGELEQLLSQRPNRAKSYVIFEREPGMAQDPATSDLWKTAAQIPGVNVIDDPQGKMVDLFHAQTSGQVLFYDAAGTLAFSGGITDSRGHAGDNEGLSAIGALLESQTPRVTRTPVYGCSLK